MKLLKYNLLQGCNGGILRLNRLYFFVTGDFIYHKEKRLRNGD